VSLLLLSQRLKRQDKAASSLKSRELHSEVLTCQNRAGERYITDRWRRKGGHTGPPLQRTGWKACPTEKRTG